MSVPFVACHVLHSIQKDACIVLLFSSGELQQVKVFAKEAVCKFTDALISFRNIMDM
jgi:hypothetical protein